MLTRAIRLIAVLVLPIARVYVKAPAIEMADKILFICLFLSIVRFSCGDSDYSMNGTVYYTAG